MAQAAFDTIAEVQRLRDSGLEQAQAEAITRAIHAGVTGGVATKADLDLVQKDVQLVRQEVQTVKTELEGKIDRQGETLRREMAEMRAELVEDIGNVRTDVQKIHTLIATGQANQLRWMIGLAIAMLGVLVATLALN